MDPSTPASRSPGTLSPADSAAKRLRELVSENELLRREAPELTEADTRAKLIDTLFKGVLGWYEADIRREVSLDVGFVDYVLGAEFAYLHIEAKRLMPRFSIHAPSRARILELTGPHLLGNADVKAVIEQAAKYASELGSEFAVVTNGDQFIIFRPRLPGRKWREGRALVWHDYDDILEDFESFYAWLSRDGVVSGALLEALETADAITSTLYSPIEYIHNPDAELVRNRFWNKIAKIVGPLFEPEASVVQEEIIRHCYVRTPLSDQVDSSIDRLLKDKPPGYAVDAGTTDLQPGMHGQTAFDIFIEKDVKNRRPGTYVLTGGVGSGKTTFLRRYVDIVQPSFVREFCVWLHIDYLAIGSIAEDRLHDQLREYTYKQMRDLLRADYPSLWPSTGEAFRKVLSPDIDEASLTLLFGLDRDSPEWNAKVNELTAQWVADDARVVERALSATARLGLRVVIVLDNTDQLGERFQEAVFLLSQKLAQTCGALTIVALREEKFFAAYRRGIFDAYGDRRFHLGSPNLEEVIRRRLDRALSLFLEKAHGTVDLEETLTDPRQVERVLRAMIRSTTQRNQNIVRMLSCVSNGDMRYALGMFRDFVSSGNTQIDKILRIIEEDGGYTVPFHEFAKSAILGSKKYYRSGASHIVNLFLRSAAGRSSHLTAIRLLARLANSAGAPSPHGEGFVDTRHLLGEFRASFGRADDLILRAEELLRRGLLESEPPRASGLEKTEATRVTAAGMYYWRYLVRSFAYLDLVFVDTPIIERQTAVSLANLAQETDMPARFERVRVFLDYLAREEERELAEVQAREGPYGSSLISQVYQQIEREFAVVGRKIGH